MYASTQTERERGGREKEREQHRDIIGTMTQKVREAKVSRSNRRKLSLYELASQSVSGTRTHGNPV